jgi:hypothetical protein
MDIEMDELYSNNGNINPTNASINNNNNNNNNSMSRITLVQEESLNENVTHSKSFSLNMSVETVVT